MSHINLQIERLLPDQIYSSLQKRALIYMPLGAIEYHGLHLPIGLDSLTSHGICLRAAQSTGGLVMPSLYYGMTGSIGHHPWTILLEKEETFLSIILDTIRRIEQFGVDLVVIFTGHFGRRQLAALERLDHLWKEESRSLRILPLSISGCPHAEMRGDHGAIFETSILQELHPELVKLDKLPEKTDFPADDPGGDSWGKHRRDPGNVLFGILGDDPRAYDPEEGRMLFNTIVKWLEDSVESAWSNVGER